MSARILIVEDEPDLRSLIEHNVSAAGYKTEAVGNGFAALQAIEARPPDLVILDLMLPDLPGTHICREIRARPNPNHIAVLMLTAKDDEASRVKGLELGADDYVVKPVSMRELVLRVRAILQRRGAPLPANAPLDANHEVVQSGRLRVDLAAHQAFRDGELLDLTPLELKLLATLLERVGRAQSRERLLHDVWESQDDSTSRTVDTHVKRLRDKLGSAADLIETVRGLGYRLRKED